MAQRSYGPRLIQCASSNDCKAVQETFQALSAGPPEVLLAAVNYRDQHGRTPLMMAVVARSHDMVNQFLQHGADINLVSREVPKPGPQGTALHMAIQRGYLDIANLLLAHGANPLLCSPTGRTCLDDAFTQGVGCDILINSMLDSLVNRNQVWSGDVDIKMGTLMTKYKTHILKVFRVVRTPEAPRIPNQPQMQMHMYCKGQVRARVWLDGSLMDGTPVTKVTLGLLPGRVPIHCDGLLLEDKGGRKCFTLRAASGKHEVLEQLRQIVETGQVAEVIAANRTLPIDASFQPTSIPQPTDATAAQGATVWHPVAATASVLPLAASALLASAPVPGSFPSPNTTPLHKTPSDMAVNSQCAATPQYLAGSSISPYSYKPNLVCVACRRVDVPLTLGLAHHGAPECRLCSQCQNSVQYMVGQSCPLCWQKVDEVYALTSSPHPSGRQRGSDEAQELDACPTIRHLV